jgi:protein phosphatase
MVVKSLDYITRRRRGLAQPALKTRGREYLRIICGPEYTEPANFERLRERGDGRKRSLASREFALGIEALERFVRGAWPVERAQSRVADLIEQPASAVPRAT